ncbi:hypothetical protein [uncultured Winogradskyella sp.]|uniref:hypothetical protein n=1 Tax=uncultured Winogradskyella sp. TaxID=395353 RepID=UPI0026322343|nr:hypothetical protein [uncultured Winogradskyella sp.]|tara:strand:- start:848 stop:1204 length:357 start_codon:yes stop_codon:yes gene_type:complete
MKNILIIVGFITAILATVLSATKFYSFSVLPIIIAFISGLVLLFITKKAQSKTKPIQYIFLLVIMSLGLTIYKNITIIPKTIETEQIKQTDQTDQVDKDDQKNIELIDPQLSQPKGKI